MESGYTRQAKFEVAYRGGRVAPMPNQPKTPSRTIRFDDETWEAVRARAAAEGSTISDVIRAAVGQYMTRGADDGSSPA